MPVSFLAVMNTPYRHTHQQVIRGCIAAWFAGCRLLGADFQDPNADRDALPMVPPGFEISFFAREPLVRQPCSMAFDARGRLCVGMGPQYRNPTPETPGDSVVLVLDTDGNGKADRAHTFATGFNAIQGLAWHGRDLWVANAPDLTIVRDFDGDDEADEYVRIYTDLGNLEHGLHGLNWGPDGRLYMSKGNSKGLTQSGRLAPKAFRDLWGMTAPAGSPDFPQPRVFKKGDYQRAYHDPADDWGREGGVLRCDDGGANLEIVARGFRNPWDITFDTGFHWLGTDNDQTTGDRVFMPFLGAHFGWNHPWSAHWGTEFHAPSAPVSGPLFEGSGTGVVFGDSPAFPSTHRGVFFINDWLRKTTFVWRPHWDGALLRPSGGEWEPFVQGGKSLFRPTDLDVGPDGALWILGWSAGYGAEYGDGQMTSEGRVFRVAAKTEPPAPGQTPKRGRPHAQWTVAELVEDFDGPLPVWRIDAQDELVRRGPEVMGELHATLRTPGLNEARQTWTAWTLGRMNLRDRTIEDAFAGWLVDPAATLNLRLQALRILGDRVHRAGDGRDLPVEVANALRSSEPRLRMEAIQAIGRARQRSAVPVLLETINTETDPTTFYAGWQTLRGLETSDLLKLRLADSRGGVRRAALLALLETHALNESEVRPLAMDSDPTVKDLALLWLRKAGAGGEAVVVRGRPLNPGPSELKPVAKAASGSGLARNIRARSGTRHLLSPGGLRVGAKPYVDRGYVLKEVPPMLEGLDFIQTANDDDGSQGEAWLSFEALMPVRVHIAFDARGTEPPWLRDHFQRTQHSIRADHWTFHDYVKEFPAGRVELGGNTENGRAGGKGNYIVALEPLPLASPSNATTLEQALGRLSQSNPERGEWLFHAPGGAGCFNCHRLGEHGNGFAPDLAALGERATARHIVQSMLEPNAVITEGFRLQTVQTADAEYSGILLEESGLSVTLGLATGQRQVFPKSRIISRTTASTSAMPAYDTVLTPQYAADLGAYLLAQKSRAAVTTPPPGTTLPRLPDDVREAETAAPAAWLTVWPKGDGFRFTENADRLVIAHSGQPVVEFVYRDEKILRPYFANFHAPGGVKATRNHPPVAGVDATDHDTMHPGLWLAFGDINGTDFWRNKGRMEHVRFTEPPVLRDGGLFFATECRLRAPDGQTLSSLTNRFTLTSRTNAWILVWDATFHAGDKGLTFGDQEEMGFGARVATAITEKNGGAITSSAGLKTAKTTWGQPAEWCDYSGNVDGHGFGVTLMADPGNFRPSWWHNRDYGVFVANPFGREAMKQGAKSAVSVNRGELFHLRFGAVIHSGSGFNPALAAQEVLR
jgi:putative membrane-bound dehydrogenase-like protein